MNKDTCKKVVVCQGPSPYTATTAEQAANNADIQMQRSKITDNTPAGYDPLVYWHQVAMDAIKSGEKDRTKCHDLSVELSDLKNDMNRLTNRLIERTADKSAQIPFDITRLVNMASVGTIELDVSIHVKQGKHDMKGGWGHEDSEEDE